MTISVVIPCRNEEAFIRPCVESVLAWETQGESIEVLVVDGRSTDGTRRIVGEMASIDDRVRVLDNPSQHKPNALNIGIRAASGDWIVRLDAHSRYPPDYLQRCLETARRTGADNVGGVFIAQLREETIQARLVQALTTHWFGVGSAGFRLASPPEGPADTVPYGCFRREAFDRFGYFDERLTHSQDFEFNQRIRRRGGRIWLNPKIEVFYYNQARLADFLRKVWERDGPWTPFMWYVAPYSFRLRHAVPILFALALLASVILSPFGITGRALLLAIMVPYVLLAAVAGYQQAVRYDRWWIAPLLPPLFFAYHAAHGFGGLRAILQLMVGAAPVQRLGRPRSPEETRSQQ